MKSINRVLARARRRLLIQRFITSWGWLAVLALGVATVLVLVERLAAVPIWPGVYAVIIGAVPLIAALWYGWATCPTMDDTAAKVDDRLHLKDQMTSALFAARLDQDPFARRVIDQAVETSGQVNLAESFPVGLGRGWPWVVPTMLAFALAATMVPTMDLMGLDQARKDQTQRQSDAQQSKEQVVEAVKAIEMVNAMGDGLDGKHPHEGMAEGLKDLAQLARQDLSDPKARQQAAAKLSEARQSLAQQAEKTQRQLELSENALSRLDPKESGPADKMVQAMRRGDFEAASEAVKELADAVEKLDPEQRRQLEDQLDQLAQQLEQAARDQAHQQAEAQRQIESAMRQAGLSQEQAQEALDRTGQGQQSQDLQQWLKQQGMTAQQAQEMARQLQEMQNQKDGYRNASQQSQQMAQAMERMSQTTNRNPNDPQDGSGQPSEQFRQSSKEMSRAFSELAKMREELRQAQRAQGQCDRAINRLADGQPMGGSESQQGQQQARGGQQGANGWGQNAGNSDGGDPIGAHRRMGGYQSRAEGDLGESQGRTIASWMSDEEATSGDAGVAFNEAVTQARNDAERAITEDRVPRRYHDAVIEYFNQLPDQADQVTSPPPAPR